MACVIRYLLAAGVFIGSAHGQTFPIKPIRIVVSAPGGGNDFTARLLAAPLSGTIGQQVIVENRSSLGAIETVAKSSPDGYTLLIAAGTLWISPLMQDKPAYDPIRDFSPVAITNRTPNVLVVHPSLPVKTVKELIALAKSRPGQLNYATGGSGASPHLAAELFKANAGIDIVRINFKGSGPALNSVVSGEVHLMFPLASVATAHVKSGRLRALAVTNAEPSPVMPGLPSISAALAGYEASSTTGMFAPSHTPVAVITRLNQEVVRTLARPDVKERFFSAGVETVGSSPEALAAVIRSDTIRLGKVIKDAGIRED